MNKIMGKIINKMKWIINNKTYNNKLNKKKNLKNNSNKFFTKFSS